jgi:hypothetical protein
MAGRGSKQGERACVVRTNTRGMPYIFSLSCSQFSLPPLSRPLSPQPPAALYIALFPHITPTHVASYDCLLGCVKCKRGGEKGRVCGHLQLPAKAPQHESVFMQERYTDVLISVSDYFSEINEILFYN